MKKFCLDSDDSGFIWAGVNNISGHSVIKQTGRIWYTEFDLFVTNLLLFEHQQKLLLVSRGTDTDRHTGVGGIMAGGGGGGGQNSYFIHYDWTGHDHFQAVQTTPSAKIVSCFSTIFAITHTATLTHTVTERRGGGGGGGADSESPFTQSLKLRLQTTFVSFNWEAYIRRREKKKVGAGWSGPSPRPLIPSFPGPTLRIIIVLWKTCVGVIWSAGVPTFLDACANDVK